MPQAVPVPPGAAYSTAAGFACDAAAVPAAAANPLAARQRPASTRMNFGVLKAFPFGCRQLGQMYEGLIVL